MNKNFFILIVFWWSMLFPSLSLNSFTTDIYDENIRYSDLYSIDCRNEILKSVNYDFFIETIILFSDK